MMGYMKDDAPGLVQPPPEGWYDTGDIVAVDEDGFVAIQGRTKRFAKIAGEMVSLAAVEAVLQAVWPGANHAVVSIPDARKGEMLVLLTEHEAATLDGLSDQFRSRGLTELSVPRRIVRIKPLPLLGTGKTDYVMAQRIAMEQPE